MATLDDAKGVVEGLSFPIEAHRFVGTCFINGEGQDVDILILTLTDLDDTASGLKEQGWAASTSEEYPSDAGWFAARKGLINLLITADEEFYWAMSKGADVCRNLVAAGKIDAKDKDARIIIHRTLTGEAL